MWKQCSYNRDTKIVLYQLPSSVASEEENENEEGSVVQVMASEEEYEAEEGVWCKWSKWWQVKKSMRQRRGVWCQGHPDPRC